MPSLLISIIFEGSVNTISLLIFINNNITITITNILLVITIIITIAYI